MKILYIANIRFPTEKAHGGQIAKMCESFSIANAKVELAIPSRSNKKFELISSYKYYRVKSNFTIKKILSFDPVWLMKVPASIYIRIQSLFFMLSLFFYLLFKKNRGEYIFYTRDEYLLSFLQLFSKKIVWEGHALPVRLKKYKKRLDKCLAITVLTKQMKNKIAEVGISGDKILVSPDAVDLSIFDINISKQEARKQLGLPKDKFLLGYTGSLKTKDMDKGVADILKALKSLGEDLKFVAVGGNEREIKYYEKLARENNVDSRVKFLERVTPERLAVYQKAFDILMMPFPKTEHFSYYMSPLKMFEYMAAKRPILTTDLPTIREVLDETMAYLAEPNNPESIVRGVKYIMAKAESEEMSQAAYNEVKKYTWQKRAENILNFTKKSVKI